MSSASGTNDTLEGAGDTPEGINALSGGNGAPSDGLSQPQMPQRRTENHEVASPTGRYRCLRSEFTLREYEAFEDCFWLMPTAWGESEMLADLKRSGGAAAISILPWLGRIAAQPKTQPWPISAEELGRVCGVNPKSVRHARDVLQQMGLVSTEVRQRHGARLLHWRVNSQLIASETYRDLARELEEGEPATREPYFYFSFRLLYGGHWFAMSPVQRAIYLAAATLALVHRNPPREDWLLRPLLPRFVDLRDIEASYRLGGAAPNEYRLACASYTELARISGYEVKTVMRAVQGFKHPRHWNHQGYRKSSNDQSVLTYHPIWVYPTLAGSSLVYHFRDHVHPWPWAVENARIPFRGEDDDSPLPF